MSTTAHPSVTTQPADVSLHVEVRTTFTEPTGVGDNVKTSDGAIYARTARGLYRQITTVPTAPFLATWDDIQSRVVEVRTVGWSQC